MSYPCRVSQRECSRNDPWTWLVQLLACACTAEPGSLEGTLPHGIAECKAGKAVKVARGPGSHHWAKFPPKHPGWKSILVLSAQENKRKGDTFWDWGKAHTMDSMRLPHSERIGFLATLQSLGVFGVQTQWASRSWNVQRKLSSCLLSVTVQSPYSSPSPSLGSEGLPGWLVSPSLLPFLETALCGCDSHSLSRCPLRSHYSTPISQASSHIEALTLARRCSGQLRKPRSQQFRIWYHLKHTFPESL